MQPTTSNIFHTSLVFHPSSLTAKTNIGVNNGSVASQWYCTIGSCYGTRGMEAPSWIVVSPEFWRVSFGGNA